MDFLITFLEDFRGCRKIVFLLKIVRSKSAGNHAMLQPKSKKFQGFLTFILNTEKILLWDSKEKGKIQTNVT